MNEKLIEVKQLIESYLKIAYHPKNTPATVEVTDDDDQLIITVVTGSREYPYFNPIILVEQIGNIMEADILEWMLSMDPINGDKNDQYRILIHIA